MYFYIFQKSVADRRAQREKEREEQKLKREEKEREEEERRKRSPSRSRSRSRADSRDRRRRSRSRDRRYVFKTHVFLHNFWLVAAIAVFIQIIPSLRDHKNPANSATGEENERQIVTLRCFNDWHAHSRLHVEPISSQIKDLFAASLQSTYTVNKE